MNPAAAGLSYLPEFGRNLESFPDARSILSTESVDNDWEKVEFGGPSGSPRGFGRVRVEMLRPMFIPLDLSSFRNGARIQRMAAMMPSESSAGGGCFVRPE